MAERQTDETNIRPRHWIGVKKGWQLLPGSPLDRLVSVPPEKLKTHALVIGATGSGKTNLLHHLIAQDIITGHSFAVLDMRGDLVGDVAGMCHGRVDPMRARIIDLREKVRHQGFDPLHGAGEPYFRALNVLDAVESESDSWGVQLSETLRNALMLLADSGQRMTRLEDLFYDRHFLAGCVDACRLESVAAFWTRFADLSRDRQAALASPVLNKVSLLLATDTLRRILGHPNPVDLGAHLNSAGSVTLVSLAVDEAHSAGLMMGKLALSSICREIFARVEIPQASRVPVRLYVDEFEHFGMDEFDAILAEGRRFGLSLVLAHQTLAQLSPRMRSMVLGNVGVKLVFRTGREDSAVLSRDITGNANAADFTALPTGECGMWSRNVPGLLHVEVNAPIVRGDGTRSSEEESFRNAVAETAGRYDGGVGEKSPRRNGFSPPAPTKPEVPDTRAVFVAPNLEAETAVGSGFAVGSADDGILEAKPKIPQSSQPPTKPSRGKSPRVSPPAKPTVNSRLEDWLCG